MKTSERINSLVARVKAAFAAADASTHIFTEHAPRPGTSPASKIAASFERERIQKSAPSHAADIRAKLKADVRSIKAEFAALELEALAALQLSKFLTAETDTLPASLPPAMQAAALTLNGTPEATLVARQLHHASENVHAELKRLNQNYWLKTDAAVSTVASKSALAIFRAADMPRHAAVAERLVIRAQAGSEGVRKRVLSTRMGAK